LHEMGHALGFGGTFGGDCRCFCECDAPDDVAYTCPDAQQTFNNLGFPGTLLLESEGGSGTECGHWENDLFTESWIDLMIGTYQVGRETFLSAITVAAMGEIGEYVVDMDAAGVPSGGTSFGSFVLDEPFDLNGLIEEVPPVSAEEDGSQPPPPPKKQRYPPTNAKSGKKHFGDNLRQFFGFDPKSGSSPSPPSMKSIKNYRRQRRG